MAKIPAPAQDVLKASGATFLKAVVPVLVLAWTKYAAGQTVSISAAAQGVLAAIVAAAALIYHGLPVLVGQAKAARVNKGLAAIAAVEAAIRADLAKQASPVVVDTPPTP